MKKDVAITIRISQDVAEKFKYNAQEMKMSQGEYLTHIVEKTPEVQSFQQGNRVELILKKERVTGNEEADRKFYVDTKKFVFEGQWLNTYFVNDNRVPASIFEEELKEDFGIEISSDHMFYYYIAVYRCDKSRKILAQEQVAVYNANKLSECILNVQRCVYCDGLEDIKTKFKKYISCQNLLQIEQILAIEIDEDNLDQYF